MAAAGLRRGQVRLFRVPEFKGKGFSRQIQLIVSVEEAVLALK